MHVWHVCMQGIVKLHFVHNCYTKLSGVATFSIAMTCVVGLLCDWKAANHFQESK